MPSERLRKLEEDANAAFDQYREMYFEGGVSSVYLWDLDQGFAGVILIKKAGDGSKKIRGCWDSIHVVEVQEKSSGRSAHYKLTSTSMLWLQTNKSGSGTMNLGGSLTRQVKILWNKKKYGMARRVTFTFFHFYLGRARLSCQRSFPAHSQHWENGRRHGEQDQVSIEFPN